MAFANGQLVQAADLNNLSVTSVTTVSDVTVGDDLSVAGDTTIGGVLAVTGSLTVGGVPISSSVTRGLCCGRLTLTSATPVTPTDVTAATTLYWALYNGNQVALYNSSEWVLLALTELSISVPAVANQMYDVFLNYNSGTPILSLTAWTNDSTRATPLTKQDGVLVKSGSPTQRYVGSCRTTTVAGQTEDSDANRLVWNYYHQKPRGLRKLEATNSWTYTTAAWRQMNGSAANQVGFVIGVAEVHVGLTAVGFADNSGGASHFAVGIGLDTVAAPTTGCLGMKAYSVATAAIEPGWAQLNAAPAAGYHYAAPLEYAITTSSTTTWYGDNNTPTLTQAGVSGMVLG